MLYPPDVLLRTASFLYPWALPLVFFSALLGATRGAASARRVNMTWVTLAGAAALVVFGHRGFGWRPLPVDGVVYVWIYVSSVAIVPLAYAGWWLLHRPRALSASPPSPASLALPTAPRARANPSPPVIPAAATEPVTNVVAAPAMAPASAMAPAMAPAPAVPPAPVDPPLRARNISEARLYLDCVPCACGGIGIEVTKNALLRLTDTGAIKRWIGACRRCGAERRVLLEVPHPADHEIGGMFGGDQPSALLDPGQWYLASDRFARGVPADTAGLEAPALSQARIDMQQAIACLEEALKFIPAGGDEVPPDAFRSDEGRRERDRLPGQFCRARAEVRIGVYRQLLSKMA